MGWDWEVLEGQTGGGAGALALKETPCVNGFALDSRCY